MTTCLTIAPKLYLCKEEVSSPEKDDLVTYDLPPTDYVGGAVLILLEDLYIAFVKKSRIQAPWNATELFYVSPRPIGVRSQESLESLSKTAWGAPEASGLCSPLEVDALYAGAAFFAHSELLPTAEAMIRATGDVRMIDLFKEQGPEFIEEARAAAFDSSRRYLGGFYEETEMDA